MVDLFRRAWVVRLAFSALAVVGTEQLIPAAQSTAPAFQARAEFVGSSGDITKVLIVEDRGLVVGISSHTLYVWDIAGGKLVSERTVEYPENRLRDAVVGPSNKLMAYLVSGDRSEVVFVSLDTGQRIDVSNGQPVAASGSDRPGAGSWRLPPAERGPNPLIPRGVAIKEANGTQLASVAVAYSSGVIHVLDVSRSAVSTVNTDMGALRDVNFNKDGALAWVGANGYGILNATGQPQNTPFPNSSAWLSDSQIVMLSHRDGTAIVRTQPMSGSPREARWNDSDVPIEQLQPFGNSFLALYGDGRIGLRDASGTAIGPSIALRPRAQIAGDIAITDVAVSPKGLIAVARGPVVTVYQPTTAGGR